MVLSVCRAYGWGLDEVMRLTMPQFRTCYVRARQVLAWETLHGTTMGVAAALSSKAAEALADTAGSVSRERMPEYTQAALDAANRRMEEIAERIRRQERETAK